MNDLIITAVFGEDAGFPEAFLQSGRACGIKADLIVIRHKHDRDFRKRLAAAWPSSKVIVPACNWAHPWVRRCLQKTNLTAKAATWVRGRWQEHPRWASRIERIVPYFLGIMAGRFFAARSFLKSGGNHYARILLTDSRDVFFQSDPFVDFDGGLLIGLENCAVQEQPQNWLWLQKVYQGEAGVLQKLSLERVICAGVTLGTKAEVLRYLDLLCGEMIRRLPWLAYTEYVDQAVHNKILRETHGLDLRVTDNTAGRIAHLATSDLAEFNGDTSSGLRTKRGNRVGIVHQYDRHPHLAKLFLVGKQRPNGCDADIRQAAGPPSRGARR